mgnify:CR=1 FL=1
MRTDPPCDVYLGKFKESSLLVIQDKKQGTGTSMEELSHVVI